MRRAGSDESKSCIGEEVHRHNDGISTDEQDETEQKRITHLYQYSRVSSKI